MLLLICTAIALYAFLLTVIMFYLTKMNRLKDTDAKLKLTYNTLTAIPFGQIIALVCIIAYYAIKLNCIDIDVPDIAAVLSMVLQIIGFALTGYFWFVYRKKHFPDHVSRKEGKTQRKAVGLNLIITVGAATSAMNFVFNLMLVGAIAYLVG